MSQVERVQGAITKFWDTVATHYESHGGNTAPLDSDSYRRWVAVFQQYMPFPPADVLDTCCGTGFAALICSGLGHRVTGVDLAPNMLAIARQLATERGLGAQFVEGDAVNPPFDHESFDAVVSRHSLWTLRSANEALRRWHQLLRPGGRVVLIDAFHSWDTSVSCAEEDDFFGQHYTSEVRASLPFMKLQSESPLMAAFTEANFGRLEFQLLDRELSPDLSFQEYALIAYR